MFNKKKIKGIFTPDDIKEFDFIKDVCFPGEEPYTSGIHPTMYRGKLWTMRQYSGYGTAEETNARYKYLLNEGQTGLSVAFDLPTQIGYDSDSPFSKGEVGRCGVAIDTLKDMETLFDGIPLDKVSTSMTINAPAIVILAMYIAVAEKQGIDIKKLEGTVQNDILKEYVARGTYIFPPRESLHLTANIFRFCSEKMPKWNTISISGYHMREAGCSSVQEVAFTFSNAIEYLRTALNFGLELEKIANRISFFFSAHNNFLEEVAKFRAARRLWARIMKEKFNAKNPRAMQLRFHTQTAGCTLTAQEAENNVVRVALQALAAVLGGAQSIHTNSMDEAWALPSEEAVRLALRTQQIIAYESGVTNVIDPLSGSYYIEYMTAHIEEEAKEYIEKIEDMGGAVSAIEKGFMQKEIADSAYKYQMEVEKEERIVVGVNRFIGEEKKISILKLDESIEKKQKERLENVKRNRDKKKINDSLEILRKKVKTNEVFETILMCVKEYATLGEICDVLRGELGEYKPMSIS
ncbi:MAG: methylmalonyl-CoA mutase family protein [Candidatus Thermoplasmatota archaeon]